MRRRHPTNSAPNSPVRRAPGGAWSRRAGCALLAACLTLGQPAIGLLERPRVATAETRPYNTALLVASDTGLALDSVVTDGTTLAWLDTRGAIYTRTLADGREARVLDGPAKRSQLAIGGGVLVWVERGTDGVALRGLRLGGDPFTIASGAGERNSPAISGNTVVWRDGRAGGWQIAGYNLDTKSPIAIAADLAARGAVAIAGNTVVWEEYRGGHWGLVAYDLQAQRVGALTGSTDDDTAPSVGTDFVAFVRRHAGRTAGALVLRDLRSGQEKVITDNHLVLRPSIAGDLVVWEDWRDGVPNVYAFDRVSGKEFPLDRTEDARDPAIGGTVVAWLGQGQFSARVTAVRLVKPLPSDPQDPPTVTDPDVYYYTETKHSVAGAFRQFWAQNGGVPVFGFPLTEAFEETGSDGVKRQVQYFERAKLEADPQDAKKVALARLGAELTAGKNFPTVAASDSTDNHAYFPQTGHALNGWFLKYWQDHGGVNVFGFPISEEVVENGRTVQYFERARFELRSGSTDPASGVALGQIGREALVKLGWLAPEQNPAP